MKHSVKFLNFGTTEIFAVIYLIFKQRGQAIKGILSKWCKWNSKSDLGLHCLPRPICLKT